MKLFEVLMTKGDFPYKGFRMLCAAKTKAEAKKKMQPFEGSKIFKIKSITEIVLK